MLLESFVVAVGSTNPIKVEPVRTVLARAFSAAMVVSVNAASGVPEQPIGPAQIRQGARNRALHALKELLSQSPAANGEMRWGVGLEGGVDFEDEVAWLTGAVAIVTNQERSSLAWCPRCPLPPRVADALHAGGELGPIMDELTGITDSKTKHGAIGYLTNGLALRGLSWEIAFACALAPFLHPELYP
ncbi:MAG TPA: inosine/xanthosine triphosphatase [Ktedonobacterales bacterium]|nr:inosine/xanthosine triphosphatase [Ktedonobacterales bacterium]